MLIQLWFNVSLLSKKLVGLKYFHMKMQVFLQLKLLFTCILAWRSRLPVTAMTHCLNGVCSLCDSSYHGDIGCWWWSAAHMIKPSYFYYIVNLGSSKKVITTLQFCGRLRSFSYSLFQCSFLVYIYISHHYAKYSNVLWAWSSYKGWVISRW